MDWSLLTIKAQVRDLRGQAQGIKEDIAMYLERYGGDVRVISVEVREPPPPEQMKIGGGI